ncbi:MAG: hypothetical protein HFG40_03280 [Bacilli bacterium]|nr:hypothetical protein [Bacilli bacterium]
MSIGILFLIAVGLSMDAFSLALIYGTLNMQKKYHNLMSLFVGIFHFFMPLLGYFIGKIIFSFLPIQPEIIAGIIFIALAIEMLLSLKKDEPLKLLENIYSICLFAFTVSIDSFSIGIGLGNLTKNMILASLIFSITSGVFTYCGVKLGDILVKKFGNIATLVGAIILLSLGIHYIF